LGGGRDVTVFVKKTTGLGPLVKRGGFKSLFQKSKKKKVLTRV